MTATEDRRRFHRFPFEAQGLLSIGHATRVPCDLLDLSISGALLAFDEPLDQPTGSRGELGLILRGLIRGDRVDIRTRIEAVWQDDQQMGCRFIGIDPDSFEHLKSFIEDNLGDPLLLDRELMQLGYWPGVEESSEI